MRNKGNLWYAVGSGFNAATSAFMFIIINFLSGSQAAGLFSIAIAIAQQMLIIGRFEVRTYQITDVNIEFTFSNYYSFRIISCTIMLLSSFLLVLFGRYDLEKTSVIILLCIFKCTEAFSDVFQGLFQLQGHLDYVGKTMAVREGLFIIMGSFFLVITGDIIGSLLLACVISITWVLFYDVRQGKRLTEVNWCMDFKIFKSLSVACLPIFVSVFLNVFIVNLPKYMIDRYLSVTVQSYFNMVFLPASTVNLLSMIAFFPLLPGFAVQWETGEVKKLAGNIGKAVIWISALTLMLMLAGNFVGIPVLNLIYRVDLTEFKSSFLILLAGGGMSALVSLFTKLLVLLRKQFFLIIMYMAGIAIVVSSAAALVKNGGIAGASLLYLISMSILAFISLIYIILTTLKRIAGAV